MKISLTVVFVFLLAAGRCFAQTGAAAQPVQHGFLGIRLGDSPSAFSAGRLIRLDSASRWNRDLTFYRYTDPRGLHLEDGLDLIAVQVDGFQGRVCNVLATYDPKDKARIKAFLDAQYGAGQKIDGDRYEYWDQANTIYFIGKMKRDSYRINYGGPDQ